MALSSTGPVMCRLSSVRLADSFRTLLTAPTNTSPVLLWMVRWVREVSNERYITLPDDTEGGAAAARAVRTGEEKSMRSGIKGNEESMVERKRLRDGEIEKARRGEGGPVE